MTDRKEEHQTGIGLRTRPVGRPRKKVKRITIEGSQLKFEEEDVPE